MVIDAVIQVSLKDKLFLLDNFLKKKSLIAMQCDIARSLDFVRDVYVLLPANEKGNATQAKLEGLNISCIFGSVENLTERYRTFFAISDCDVVLRLTGDSPYLSRDALTVGYALFCGQPADLMMPWGYPCGVCGEIISIKAIISFVESIKTPAHPLYYIVENQKEFVVMRNVAPHKYFRPDIDARVRNLEMFYGKKIQYVASDRVSLDALIDTYDKEIEETVLSPLRPVLDFAKSEKNILFMTHSPNMGGSEISLLALAKEAQKIFNVWVGVGGEGGNFVGRLKKEDVAHTRIKVPLHTKIGAYAQEDLGAFIAFLKRNRIGVVYANSYFTVMLAGLVARACPDMRIICHMRDLIYKPEDIWHMGLNTVNGIFANSKAVRELLVDCGISRQRISIIYNWIDTELFYKKRVLGEAFLETYGIKKQQFTIGYAGQIVSWKGIDDLITALSYLKADGISFMCYMAGMDLEETSPYQQQVKAQLIERGLNQHVHMFGFVDDMNAFYNSIDVLIVPTRKEPFGRVAMEAMAAEVPIIATRSGGLAEIIDDGKNGFLVDEYAPDQIAEKVKVFYGAPQLGVHFGKAGAQKVKSEFDKKMLSTLWLNELRLLVENVPCSV
jgi:L-malate glycosyltransferase